MYPDPEERRKSSLNLHQGSKKRDYLARICAFCALVKPVHADRNSTYKLSHELDSRSTCKPPAGKATITIHAKISTVEVVIQYLGDVTPPDGSKVAD